MLTSQIIEEKLKKYLSENDKINLITDKINRIEIPIGKINILSWLREQKSTIKTYWLNKNQNTEVAGIGAADIVTGDSLNDFTGIFNRLRKYLSSQNQNIRYYGGAKFRQHDKLDHEWNYFGDYRFISPSFELINKNKNMYFACNFKIEKNETLNQKIKIILNQINDISFDEIPFSENEPAVLSAEVKPDFNEWEKMVLSILDLIKFKKIEKVVLARKFKLNFSSEVDPYILLKKIQSFNSNSIFFAFQPAEHLCFIGSTPELLYRRKQDQIYSEAIAGTRIRGYNAYTDKDLEADLMHSEKERREHLIVFNSVKETLGKVCSQLDVCNKTSVLKLSTIQHLFSNFQGMLKKDISDAEIISLLHPTPAVGGYPKEAALDQIDSLEPFSRGWYGGPMGWVGNNESEFAVAIRAGLINNTAFTLYSGAGIVEGSDPYSEWKELESKISNYLKVLGMKQETIEKNSIKNIETDLGFLKMI